jgi:hypothetical protein
LLLLQLKSGAHLTDVSRDKQKGRFHGAAWSGLNSSWPPGFARLPGFRVEIAGFVGLRAPPLMSRWLLMPAVIPNGYLMAPCHARDAVS